MSIILFLLVLGVLILSHEFGHFIVAKKNGIRVDEFAIGFPPRLFKIKKGETLYSINLIPIGGYVKIHGEEGDGKEDPRSFASKSIGARSMVIVAGVIFNLILAWILLSTGFIVGLPMSTSSVPKGAIIENSAVAIVAISKNSPADLSGLEAGDELIEFSKMEDVQTFVSENKGKEIEIKYKRGDEFSSVTLTPRINPPKEEGAIGIAMDEIGILKFPWYLAPWEGLKTTYYTTIAIAVTIFYFLADLIRGLAGLESILGPVGIVTVTGTMTKLGLSYFIRFFAFLSINLAVVNIIPFPALDGGRLLFLFIEKIKGSPVNSRFSSIVHSVGLVILLLLMLAITYNDILRLI